MGDEEDEPREAQYNGAFRAKEPSDLKISQYEKTSAAVPLISKMMLSLQESPMDRQDTLKAHLEAVQERAAFRVLRTTAMPIREAMDGMKPSHNYRYLEQKQADEAKPRKGTVEHVLKEYGA